MIDFFKHYFNVSHKVEGYALTRTSELIKVSRKARAIYIIIAYIVFLLSPLVFLTPFELWLRTILWMVMVLFSLMYIFTFDFRIIKIIKLYLYSKSQNINRNIIYHGYMSNSYDKLCYKVFSKYNEKRIINHSNSYRCYFKFLLDNVNISIQVTSYKIIIKFNGKKEIIKHNNDSFEDILLYIKVKIK